MLLKLISYVGKKKKVLKEKKKHQEVVAQLISVS